MNQVEVQTAKFGTMIHKCSCSNKYQDEKYGSGNRVFNRLGKDTNGKARCTVCSLVIR